LFLNRQCIKSVGNGTINNNKISGRTIEITRSDFSESSNNPTEKLVQEEEYAQASVTTRREETT
jgi:hypothetical protein